MMAEGVIIDLSRSTNQRYLALPAKPGDVIIVPAAGEVTVQGWVDKPGAFKITPGMTVLGATAAAGGALFSSSATLLREQGNGGKLATPLNLAQIKSGAEPDIPLEGGDVVIVDRSAAGALPYSVYFLINRLGIGVPLIP
jgi:protein involved in polysaccharide export with SLBB domain